MTVTIINCARCHMCILYVLALKARFYSSLCRRTVPRSICCAASRWFSLSLSTRSQGQMSNSFRSHFLVVVPSAWHGLQFKQFSLTNSRFAKLLFITPCY